MKPAPVRSSAPRFQQLALAIAVSFLVVFAVAPVLDGAVRNAALLALRDNVQLRPADRGIRHYPWWDVSPGNSKLVAATEWMTEITALGFSSDASQWALGRIQLAMGDADAAAKTLQTLHDAAARNPLLNADLLISLAYGERPSEAVRFYTSQLAASAVTPQVREATAYALLADRVQTGMSDAKAAREAVLLRPEDLLANYILWQNAEKAGDLLTESRYRDRLQTLAALPEGRPAWAYTLPAMVDLIQRGIWDKEKTTTLMAYLAWHYPDTTVASEILAALAKELPQLAVAAFYQGDIYLRRGEYARAIAAYERVLTLEVNNTTAMQRLAAAHELQAQVAPGERAAALGKAAEWYARSLAAQPEDLSALWHLAHTCSAAPERGSHGSCDIVDQASSGASPAAGPVERWLYRAGQQQAKLVLNQLWEDGWVLEGVTVDESALVRGEPTDLLVFWRGPAGAPAGSQEQGWYQIGDRWLQYISGAMSLLPNGGFELGITQAGLPLGIESDMYAAPTTAKRLEQDPSLRSTVAVLQNTETYSLTSLVSNFMPVAPNTLYLQSGWLRSDSGNGYFGRAWYMDLARRYNRLDTYVRRDIADNHWQQYVGLAQPAPHAAEFQTWLLNYFSAGTVYQDDAWLVPIGMPGHNGGIIRN